MIELIQTAHKPSDDVSEFVISFFEILDMAVVGVLSSATKDCGDSSDLLMLRPVREAQSYFRAELTLNNSSSWRTSTQQSVAIDDLCHHCTDGSRSWELFGQDGKQLSR